MAIQSANQLVRYNLKIRPDFTASTRAEVEADIATYVDRYIAIESEGNNIYYVQAGQPGQTPYLRPAYEQSNYTAEVDEGSQHTQKNLYIQQSDPTAEHHAQSTVPFLWIETDEDGAPVTFWVDDGQ